MPRRGCVLCVYASVSDCNEFVLLFVTRTASPASYCAALCSPLATAQVEAMLSKYEWIAADRQYFGKANTAYDFGANDPGDVSRRLSNLEEQKV